MIKRLLMLDLDGTVRESASGKTFINEPLDQSLIPGALEAVNAAHARGWAIVGITNQGGVKAGHKTLEQCIQEQRYTLKLLQGKMQRIYFCPDDGATCFAVRRTPLWLPALTPVFCGVFRDGMGKDPRYSIGGYRKPSPGMILLAMQEAKATQFQYVGDRDEDAHAAIAAGVAFKWADHWRKSEAG